MFEAVLIAVITFFAAGFLSAVCLIAILSLTVLRNRVVIIKKVK